MPFARDVPTLSIASGEVATSAPANTQVFAALQAECAAVGTPLWQAIGEAYRRDEASSSPPFARKKPCRMLASIKRQLR